MSKAKKTFLWMGIFVAVLAAAALGYSALSKNYSAEPAPSAGSSETRESAPDFTVLNEQGEEVTLSSYFGKPIILNFWATWCPNCREEMPDFQDIHELYGDRIHVLMINETDGARETQQKAREYIAEEGYTFPVLYDTTFEATEIYAPRYIPTTVFIDAQGNVVHRQEGVMPTEVLGKWMEELLK